MPRTSYLDATIIVTLESIKSLQQPTPVTPFKSSKKYTEGLVKFTGILNTAFGHQSLPRVNKQEKMHYNINN